MLGNHNHTEKTIQDLLFSKYAGNSKYRIANVYLFFWESDFYIEKDNGYCYEFEIKISRADFKKDAEKIEKHLAMETGKRKRSYTDFERDEETGRCKLDELNRAIQKTTTVEIYCHRPNKFYYIAPEGVITKEQVPAHAGLMLITPHNQIYTAKEAPFLHKVCVDHGRALATKFYHYFITEKDRRRGLEYEVSRLKKILDKNNLPHY